MKIQYKAAAITTVFGAVIITLLSLGYNIQSHKIIINEKIKSIENISEETASRVNSHLQEKISIGMTLSSAPLIRDALLKSNSEYSSRSDDDRKQEIDIRNQKWMKTSDVKNPFIQAYMTNPVAAYLKSQQTIIPGEYGEIFLTNRYGVMIATTGKLTTLAHAHKYWWLESYNNGKGKIFLDDRGFDTSVEGYVLGVVIPIMDNNEIIGILKCNINILGRLNDINQDFEQLEIGRMRIVRTGGLIVSEHGITPLSTRLNEGFIDKIGDKERGSGIISENNEKQLIAYSPIGLTMGSEQIGFGGKLESIDQFLGNKGEYWQIIISINQEQALEDAHKRSQLIIIFGIIITFLTVIIALTLGKITARPIIELATIAQSFGEGNLGSRTDIHSDDEIGSLAKSLNKMAENLQKAFTEIKTLKEILPICSRCKKIRDDSGSWNILEKYITEHTGSDFSHTMCPECSDEFYKDEPWYKKRNKTT